MEIDWGSIKTSSMGEKTAFVKLEVGETRMRIVGKPSQVRLHWEALAGETKDRRIVCPGVGCPICKANHQPMSRYQVLVINRGTSKVEVLEGGNSIFSQIKELAMDDEYGDPTEYDIKITRQGQGRETRYAVKASPKRSPLTAEERGWLKEAPSLDDLNKVKTAEEILTMGLAMFNDTLANDDLATVGSGNLATDLSDEWDTI